MAAGRDPVRLDSNLIEQAAVEARRQKRSAPRQIEFWAELGRVVDGLVSREQAFGLRAGLLELTSSNAAPVDADRVMADFDAQRADLPRLVTRARIVYQTSQARPGCLERVDADGRVSVGRFENGEFQPLDS